MADKSIDTENGYEILKDGYYVYFEKNIGKFHKWIFCDNVKSITDTIDFYPCTDSKIQAVHVFKTEKSAQKFIDEFCINFEEHDNLKIARIPNTLGEWYESKKSARKSIKESRGQTVAELLQNASSKTKVYIYNDSTNDEFEGTKEKLKGEYSRFLYYTVNIWYIDNDKIMGISCY